MRFDGILFDMGDIFFDATPWRRWLTQELCGRAVAITYEELVVLWESLLVDVYCGRASYWDRFAHLLDRVGLRAEQVDEVTVMARSCSHEVQRDRCLFDGVSDTLAELKRLGLRLGVLSDTESPGSRIRASLASFGIADYFTAIVSSRDIGHAKPELTAFQSAVDAIDVRIDRCAFVGHDVDELDGASAAGIFTIAYNHVDGVAADVHIKHFAELVSVVQPPTVPAA